MPDANKLKRMEEEGYRIAESCATCIRGPGVHLSKDGWGKCHGPARKYIHAKHGERNLPAHWALTCDDWRPQRLEDTLGAYHRLPWLRPDDRQDYGFLLAVVDQLRDGMNNLREPMPMDQVAKVLARAAAVARRLVRDRVDKKMKRFIR